ncbi:hypothetical protein R3P38DRAFT_3266929 [Favolaschia claudopus]|uniref:GATA-type domain-containing protein n=1 Tax=Favolaschia claudopus TaxID=2862362 RepID=A0AAW0BTI5_9AGAR
MSSSRLPSSTAGGSLSERDRAVATKATGNAEPQSVGNTDVKYDLVDPPTPRGAIFHITDPLSSLPLSLPSSLSSAHNDTDAAIGVRLVEAAHYFARSGGAEVHASEMLYLMQRRIHVSRLRELLELSALAREFLVDDEPSAGSHSRPEHDDHVVRVRQEVNTTPPWCFATTSGFTDHHYSQASSSGVYPSTSGLPVEPRHGEFEQSRAPGMTPEFRNGLGTSACAFHLGSALPVGPVPSQMLVTTAPPFFQSPLPPAPPLGSAWYRALSPATPKNKRRHHAPGKLTRKPGRCTNPGCDVTESTEWRTHPQTKAPLCNSCGQKIRAAFKKSSK